MQEKNRYPKIRLRSKNDLAKRIASSKFPQKNSLRLINIALRNFDNYWHDVKKASEPEKNKYVRSINNTPLEKLLKLVNDRILFPYDNLVPGFIFGGVSKKDHIKAAYHLLGNQRKRTKLSLDIHRFFEQNSRDRVFYFFNKKCKCTEKVSNLLANLTCVPLGPKGSTGNNVLARGFPTSTRLALWCNIDLFMRVYWEAKQTLKNRNSKIAIFVDDIGITSAKTAKKEMELLCKKIEKIFSEHDPNQTLLINKKTDIKSWFDKKGIKHLGLTIGRNKVTPGPKTKYKQREVKKKLLNKKISLKEKETLLTKQKAYKNYNHYVRSLRKLDEKSPG